MNQEIKESRYKRHTCKNMKTIQVRIYKIIKYRNIYLNRVKGKL